jgi:hypothetical protein
MPEIEKNAPVIASGSVHVNASVEAVWYLITSISEWPSWNPDISSVQLNGEVKPGTGFVWRSGLSAIRSTITDLEPQRLIAWTGRTPGISAVHIWHVSREGDNVTVRTDESWSGILPLLFRRSLHRVLQQSIDSGLEHLKNAAEGRTNDQV